MSWGSRCDRASHAWAQRFVFACACLAVVGLPVRASHAEPAVRRPPSHADPAIRLPPGTRTDAQGQRISSRGIRETSDFLAQELARRGIPVEQLGPYGARGAVVTRFVSQIPTTPWLALHVLRMAGKTMIFFVPRPSPP